MDQKAAFSLLFAQDDHICYGDEFATKVRPLPSSRVYSPFYAINPLAAKTDHVKLSDGRIKATSGIGRRSDLNVTKFQNFLFEMDNLPLDEQLALLTSLGTIFASINWSGGKSYHAVISLAVPLAAPVHTTEGVEQYKQTWRAMAASLESKLGKAGNFDRSCQNPSRLSRTPGGFRNGVEQKLVFVGKLLDESGLEELLAGFKETRTTVKQQEQITVPPEDMQDMINRMPPELFYQLKYPSYWASGTSSGNYPEIFRLTLWLIDSTGATLPMVTAFMKQWTFGYLQKTGYPESRILKAISDAYRLKGVSR